MAASGWGLEQLETRHDGPKKGEAMTDIILWYRDLSSDKVWGVADYHGRQVTFWGRRNKELSFKLLSASEQRKIDKTVEKKKAKGYRDSSFEELDTATPGFKAEFDSMITMAILGDNFKHTRNSTISGS